MHRVDGLRFYETLPGVVLKNRRLKEIFNECRVKDNSKKSSGHPQRSGRGGEVYPGHGADIARGFMVAIICLEENLKAIGMDIPKTVNGETLGGLVIDVAAINDGDMPSRSS